MTKEEVEVAKQDGYAEAQRYMQNATSNLLLAGKEDERYTDRKYVRAACGIAYSGMLVALDVWLALKGVPTARKKSILWYRDSIGGIDRKLLDELNAAYGVLHLLGYYDGVLDADTIQSGFKVANRIIERIRPSVPLTSEEWTERRKHQYSLLRKTGRRLMVFLP
jgi:hypothetical protein